MFNKNSSHIQNFCTTKSKTAPSRRTVMKDFVGNKRAQVGETMTWIVATIVIIVILVISIYIAGVSDITNKIFSREFEIKGHNDLLVTKSLTSYLLTDDGKGVVFEQLKNKENPLTDMNSFSDFNKELPKNNFYKIYEN